MNLFSNILIFALLLLPLIGLAKTSVPEILGTWQYMGPRSTDWGQAHQEMTIHFDEKGLSDLVAWSRQEQGVCRRTAHFWYDENNQALVQTNIALDPSSPADCQKREDMKIGHETAQKLRLEGDRMILSQQRADGRVETSEWMFAFP